MITLLRHDNYDDDLIGLMYQQIGRAHTYMFLVPSINTPIWESISIPATKQEGFYETSTETKRVL